MGLSERLLELFSGIQVVSQKSNPDSAADFALFVDGKKEALILADPEGVRIWPEGKLIAMWQEADDLAVIPLVVSKLRGQWYYMDLNWGSIPAMVPDFKTKEVEIWFKGYNPISELLAHIEKRKNDHAK
jgi:hypothetical protein